MDVIILFIVIFAAVFAALYAVTHLVIRRYERYIQKQTKVIQMNHEEIKEILKNR